MSVAKGLDRLIEMCVYPGTISHNQFGDQHSVTCATLSAAGAEHV